MSEISAPILSKTTSEPQRADLCCPRCLDRMQVLHESAECRGCGVTYRVDGGIIDLRAHRNDYYFNPVPREEMRRLTSSGRTQPWFITIRRFLEAVRHNPDWLDNLVADGRYAWKLFLRLPPDSRVLDLGCGLGNLTKNIANDVGHVYALDLTYERLQFARLRFEKSGVDDRVTLLAGGDSEHLPFPDQSLDCVTLSGVLEWVADDDNILQGETSKLRKAVAGTRIFFGRSNPRKVQLRFLQEIRRVLKPEGQLFVAIENRFGYGYFGRRPDHHSGLWYASLLPRFVANLYSLISSRRPYRTYTYSFSGYARLLREAGFPVQEFIGLSPGYSHLSELIPLRTRGGLWRAPRSRGLDAIRRGRHFVPAFGMICSQKESDRSSLAERLSNAIARGFAHENGQVVFSSFRVTGKHKGIVAGSMGKTSFVVKIPFSEAVAPACEVNYAFLEASRSNPRLSELLAEPLGRGEIGRLSYFVERQARGKPLSAALAASDSAVFFPSISKLLEAMNPGPCTTEALAPSGEVFRLQVLEPLEQVRQALEGSQLADRLRHYFEEQLGDLRVSRGVAHGDLSVSNLFVEGENVSTLVDWDGVDHAGLPMLDSLNYVDSVRRHTEPARTAASNVARLADWKQFGEAEREFLGSCYERWGFPLDKHAPLVCLYWLRHVAQQLEHGLLYDRPAIERRIENVFEQFLRVR